MKSRWVESDAQALVDRLAKLGVGADLALRIYSTRLLGEDPQLVLRGGGNTSLKTRMRDLVGDETEVLCIKGSGYDMATIEPAGMPAVRLAPLCKLRTLDALADDTLVRIQRANLIEPTAPTPSVETLLHAFLPHSFVDHTHANAVLSLVDQPNGADLCEEVYDGRMAFVPYLKPGFGLAKASAELYEAKPEVEGLILGKHGICTFGASAREAYEHMIEMVTLAEERLARRRNAVFVARALPARIASYGDIAPILRGACSLKDPVVEGAWRRLILDFRTSPAVLDFVDGGEVMRYSQAGPVISDHAVRIKGWPLVVPPPDAAQLDDYPRQVQEAARAFMVGYDAYVARHRAPGLAATEPIDPMPRVILVPGLGLIGLGRTRHEARISADLAESAVQTITDAEAIGRFESISEADVFACEHWGLQQAKLAKTEGPLIGQVAVITGAGGAIGGATARAFAEAGAEVALLDIDEKAAAAQAKAIGGAALAVKCDVTDPSSVRAAFARVVETFGGVDIAVSNAGTALTGLIGEVEETLLKQSFEINFYGHQRIAQAAVKIMCQQGTGGCLLFNVSKQAINPGPRFGPYGLPKAATLFLVRQYALDYGAAGIRANAVNADRIRSGLLTPAMIAERSKARGLSEKDYMAGNLLGREVTADDVAQAFLHQALALKTTADVTTVDGGNIAAALR